MTQSNTIHVVSATDNQYAQHLAVVFASLLVHLSKDWAAILYVIESGLSDENKSKLASTVRRHGGRLEYLTVRAEDYDRFDASGVPSHVTNTAFYRISIPELLRRDDVKRVIYLDCDLVVLDDLVPLFLTDLQGSPLGAVRDIGGSPNAAQLGIADPTHYFNSGVLLIDMERWRERSLSREAAEFAIRHADKMYYRDQDALNAVLHKLWRPLNPRWNVQTNMVAKRRYGTDGEDKAAIVHFTGSSKPWRFDNNHKYKSDYYKYLALTEWKDYRAPLGFKTVLKRAVKMFIPTYLFLKMLDLAGLL